MKLNFFIFKKFKDKYLITNDMGFYMFLKDDEFNYLVQEQYEFLSETTIGRLQDKMFIFNEEKEVFVERAMQVYRENKKYIFSGTSLHIFVLTNSCNMCCVYCQAQDSGQEIKGVMNKETARKAVDIALQSPNENLTFEFQGGEPLINFEIIKYIVEYTNEVNRSKNVYFTVVSNTLLLSDEMISFFAENSISVSTSLDGNREIHNANRPKKIGGGTYEEVCQNMKRLRDAQIDVGAIQTTTRKSLLMPDEILKAYLDMGLQHVFIRPLTPLGYAREHWDEIGYTPNEFIDFYKDVLTRIIELNKKGIPIIEGHAIIFLRKILNQSADNYMELRSPCGAAVGQMAYYYDGNIYTCDEGRMLAEMGKSEFKLGNVDYSNYDDLVDNDVCKITCQASVLEGLPGCSECVYMPYCGVCPVVNYAMEENIYSREINNYKCSIYKGMLDTIFELIDENPSAMEVFEGWM